MKTLVWHLVSFGDPAQMDSRQVSSVKEES